MDVFQIEFDYCESDSKEITRERSYWTGCWITVCEAAIRHAEEYEKELVSISNVLTITQQFEQGVCYYHVDEEIKPQASPEDLEEQEDNEVLQGLPEYARPPYG